MKIFRVYVRLQGDVKASHVGNVKARNALGAIRQVAGWGWHHKDKIVAIRAEEAK